LAARRSLNAQERLAIDEDRGASYLSTVNAGKVRVCFVCSGNICRSPTAEGVFKKLVAEAGLAHAFHVESFGIGDWHVGERPDPRTLRAAEARGYRLESRAQQWKVRDFERFDHVVAMDRTHVTSLRRIATSDAMKAKISLARDHVTDAPRDADVPDPYYGEVDGFDEVVSICLEACTALLANLREKHAL
jgi:protein-tyrosine phosphatase